MEAFLPHGGVVEVLEDEAVVGCPGLRQGNRLDQPLLPDSCLDLQKHAQDGPPEDVQRPLEGGVADVQ